MDLKFEKRDIVEVVSEYVDLDGPHGVTRPYYLARCPFHDDSNPSFHVFPTTQWCCCYACWSEGGDVISFVQKHLGIPFKAALKIACDQSSPEDMVKKRIRNMAEDETYDLVGLSKRMNNLLDRHGYERGLHIQGLIDQQLYVRNFRRIELILKRNGV